MRLSLAAAILASAMTGCGPAADDLHTGATVNATSEALVAVALSHLEPEPTEIGFYRRTDEVDDQGTKSRWIGGQLGFRGGWSLSLRVQKLTKALPACDAAHDCNRSGAAHMFWTEAGEEEPGYVTVFADKDGERRSAGLEGGINGDPRTMDLPISLDQLEAVVTDPAFALHSTEGAVNAGKRLPALARQLGKERRERAKARRAAQPPSSTPAAWAAEIAETLAESPAHHPVVSGEATRFSEPDEQVADGWGISLSLRDGTRVRATLVPAIGPGVNGCRPSLQCWTVRGHRLVGRPGLAGIFRGDEVSVTSVHVWVEGPTVKPTSEDYFLTMTGDEVPTQLVVRNVTMLADTLGPTTDDSWIEAGKHLDWFKE